MRVVRRTFAAAKYPKGSPERARLNLDSLTSEYMPSYRYELRTDAGGSTPYSFRTMTEAEAAAKETGRI